MPFQQMSRGPYVIAVAALVAILAGTTADARRHEAATGLAPIALHRPAPNFAFGVTAGPTSLSALVGRTIVLNFWATYCEPCMDELDSFRRLHATFGNDVALVMVSEQTRDHTDALLKTRGIDAISLTDPEGKIFSLYGVTPIPVTVVIAPNGEVKHVSVGELDWSELQAAVNSVRPANDLTPVTPHATLNRDAGTPLL